MPSECTEKFTESQKMAGARPKPKNVHLLHGTHRPDRHGPKNAKERFKRALPPCPSYLTEHAASAWDAIAPVLHAAGALTEADATALEALCVAYADWRAAAVEVEAHGRVYETESVAGDRVLKANPAVVMKSDADRRLRAWLVEFGLTPAARTKLGGEEGQGNESPWDSF